MNLVPHIVEIEQDNRILIPVNLITRLPDGELVSFSDCRLAPLAVEVTDTKNFRISSDMIEEAILSRGCASVSVYATDVSVTKVTVSVPVGEQQEVITDSILVASYRRLRHLQPVKGHTALALGSSVNVVFQGGPLPWFNKPSGHFARGN